MTPRNYAQQEHAQVTPGQDDTPQAIAARGLIDRWQRGDVTAADCPSRPILQHLTSRWGTIAMLVLATGPQRFSQLRRRVGGVSERMLAQTLQQLEADGFVHRHAHAVVPPRVDYSLTPLGQEAAVHVTALTGWIEEALPRILAARASADSATADTDMAGADVAGADVAVDLAGATAGA